MMSTNTRLSQAASIWPPLKRWDLGSAALLVFVISLFIDFGFSVAHFEVRVVGSDLILPMVLLLSLMKNGRQTLKIPLPLYFLLLAFLCSFVVAITSYGFSPAPLVRLTILVVLVAYFVAGFYCAQMKQLLPLRFFVYVGAGIAITEVIHYIAQFPSAFRSTGFFKNPNTFGIAMAASVVFPLSVNNSLFKSIWLRRVATTVLLLAVWTSGSRSAYLGLICGLLTAFFIKNLDRKEIAKYLALACIVWLVGVQLPHTVQSMTTHTKSAPWLNSRLKLESYDRDRLALAIEMIQYWQKAPLFGVGLESTRKLPTSAPEYTIHITLILLLVETGLLGLLAFLWFLIMCMSSMWNYRDEATQWSVGRSFIAMIIVLLGASVGTDIFNQRYFWFLLGCGVSLAQRKLEAPESAACPDTSTSLSREVEGSNSDDRVVAGFGDEWSRFTQTGLTGEEREKIFNDYFSIFPWHLLKKESIGADIGCGSGRWAMVVAPRVGMLHVLDASETALNVARNNLKDIPNAEFHHASVGEMPFEDESLDFAYSLGVLHHVPDTAAAIASVAKKLKPGAPFLIYLYYSFDNRLGWFRAVWKLSDLARGVISRLPHSLRFVASQAIAFGIYWPLARTARLLERWGRLPDSWPLAYYRDKSLYTMRTDALDRFGTSLEQRFSREDISRMLEEAGFEDIRFSDHEPYWCAVGIKRRDMQGCGI